MKVRRRIDDYPRVKEILGQVPRPWFIAMMNVANAEISLDEANNNLTVLLFDEVEELHRLFENLGAQYLTNVELAAVSILDQSDDKTDRIATAFEADNLDLNQLKAYRLSEGAVARSAWRYIHARHFFDQVERTNRLHNFRDVKRLFDAFALSAPRPFSSEGFDTDSFGAQLADKLDLDEGCQVSVWSDPLVDGKAKRWVIAITTAGLFTSVKTYKKGSGVDRISYLPARELVLSYAPDIGIIEVCTDDRMLRKSVAEAFAEQVLGVDLKSDPLSWKVFSLWPLRSSLELTVPTPLSHRVNDVSVVEFGVTMGAKGQSLTLRTAPGKDTADLGPRVVRAANGLPGAGRITHAKFHVKYTKQRNGKTSAFGMTVTGANKCSLANERDPERRSIGETLLQEWQMMVRFRDLKAAEFAGQIRTLLSLLDFDNSEIARDTVESFGADLAVLLASALIRRKGIEDVILLEGDDDSVQSAETAALRPDGLRELSLASGRVIASTPNVFAELFTVDVERIVHKLAELLELIGRKGKIARETDHVWRLGDIRQDGKWLPVWLTHGLEDAKACGGVDRHLRGMPNLVNGVVFSAGDTPFLAFATHPVIPFTTCLVEGANGPEIDPIYLEQSYTRALVLAQAGEGAVFKKWKPGLAQLIVPNHRPWTIDTAPRVQIVENLYNAYRTGAPGISVADTVEGTNFLHPQPAFGRQWREINGKYIRRVGNGLWALAVDRLAN